VISRTIKVLVRFISLNLWLWLITPTRTLTTLDITKISSNNYYCLLLYIGLTISFLIGRKRTVNFRNQHLWYHLAADYTIIMSRTLKVTGNHIMYDRSAWFIRVIMSSLCVLCCLPSVMKQKHDFHFFFFRSMCIIKQLLDSVFVISKIIKVSLRVTTPTSTLIILDITS